MGGPYHDEHDCPLSGSLIGYATTPPWHISQLQQPESAMRSTQSAVSLLQAYDYDYHEETPKPPSPSHPPLCNNIHPENLQYSQPSCVTWTPINKFPFHKQPVDTTAFRRRYMRNPNIPGFAVNMYEYDTVPVLEDSQMVPVIDRTDVVDEGDDRVYHLGHIRGETYSGTLKDDNPDAISDEAMRFINEMNRKTMQPIWLQRSIELLKKATRFIERGAVLMLERTSFVQFGEAVLCNRPGCPHEEGMPPDRYYLQLGVDDPSRFCSPCFERLWKGDYTDGSVVVDQEEEVVRERRDSVVEMMIPQYDGADDASSPGLSSSRWAVPEEEQDDTLKPIHTPRRDTEPPNDDSYESPSSVTSDMEWRFPPTRFQHIAASVKPGQTLSGVDKKALEYWQFVSRVQRAWDTHVRKAKYTRDYYNGLVEEDQSLDMKPENREVQEEFDEEAYEVELGLRKRDVYGTDLSEVLKKVADKKC